MGELSFVDTHCHIHDVEFVAGSDVARILENAKSAGVSKMICVGTDLKSSKSAVEFAIKNKGCFSSLAIHPHEAENIAFEVLESQMDELNDMAASAPEKLVAIGECGLDYFYHSSPEVRQNQKKLLIRHLEIAKKHNLPVIFHIRDPKSETNELGEAFTDFFEIIDRYPKIKGVIHSFSATKTELEGVLDRGFYVGLNGIMTFSKDHKQLDAAKAVPLDKMLLETDAPFLTPSPFRGTMCEPKHVCRVAEFLGELREENLELISAKTSENAKQLFNI